MKITEIVWGKAQGKDIIKYRIENKSGAYVELSSIGAGIVAIAVPDKKGKLADVVIGYPEADSYFADGPCAGKIPGRFANRIAKGHLEIDGKVYSLPINNGPNHLHGGPEGFQNKVWDSRKDGDAVEFMYFAADGEMGYPGNLKVVARYVWTEENELQLTMTAKSDAKTVINLTNHVYFNLDGEGAGNIFDHEMRLNASEYIPTDDTLIPVGEPESVAGNPMDFVTAKPIGRDIKKDFPALNFGKGYDACWIIDDYKEGQLSEAAELYSPATGRLLKVFTTQPGIQIYTGNWLEGCPSGKNGHIYHDYDGVALECQHFPDSPNRPDFPTTELAAGDVYEQAIIWAFSTK
ncbi:MAG: galactose mutarotase [Bacteroidales bacterium]|nr:galactose mutarotase [Bacteroidales bacterium]